MTRLCLFVLFLCIAAASSSCIPEKKKEEPKIHIIHVKSTNQQSDEPDMVEIHFPPELSNRRRRESPPEAPTLTCKTNKDCLPNNICDEKLKKCTPENTKKLIELQSKPPAPSQLKKKLNN